MALLSNSIKTNCIFKVGSVNVHAYCASFRTLTELLTAAAVAQ